MSESEYVRVQGEIDSFDEFIHLSSHGMLVYFIKCYGLMYHDAQIAFDALIAMSDD